MSVSSKCKRNCIIGLLGEFNEFYTEWPSAICVLVDIVLICYFSVISLPLLSSVASWSSWNWRTGNWRKELQEQELLRLAHMWTGSCWGCRQRTQPCRRTWQVHGAFLGYRDIILLWEREEISEWDLALPEQACDFAFWWLFYFSESKPAHPHSTLEYLCQENGTIKRFHSALVQCLVLSKC